MRLEKNKKAIFGYMKDLLIHLIQYPFDLLKKDRLRELVRQVQDWHALVELINAHGIIALAAYNIKAAGLEKEVPEKRWLFLKMATGKVLFAIPGLLNGGKRLMQFCTMQV